jgi:beta-glucosidase
MPAEIPYTGDKGYRLCDVGEGRVTMEEFLAQLSDEDLICLTRGEGMCSLKVTPGTAAAFGGVTDRLLGFGIPLGCCSDGPSGIRMDCGTKAFSMPSGTCQACTWNNVLVKELYDWEGMELRKNRIDSLLGPGMNIHRHPLNGRNFEYFSEDPFLTGKMAVMQLRGMRESAIAATIKHFCANNQEYRRMKVDSVISERALREIYLRGFEIAVREGAATSVMTTYGSVNGAYTASQYDLLTTILRGQFGFGGIVMTDWWAAGSEENGPESIQQTGSMIRAQNDLYMVTADSGTNANGDDTAQALAEGRITRGELQRAAYNICRFLMDTPAYLRMYGWETDLDRMLAKAREEEDQDTKPKDRLHVGQTCDVPADRISTQRGAMNVFEMTTDERGIYLLEAEVRSELGNKLAQIPMTVLLGPHVIETVSLNGGQTEWTRIKVELPLVMGDTFYLKLFFAQGGMAIRSCRITLLSDRGGSMEDFMTGRQKE